MTATQRDMSLNFGKNTNIVDDSRLRRLSNRSNPRVLWSLKLKMNPKFRTLAFLCALLLGGCRALEVKEEEDGEDNRIPLLDKCCPEDQVVKLKWKNNYLRCAESGLQSYDFRGSYFCVFATMMNYLLDITFT